jgi:excisionase family DNA binding protein
MKQAISPKQVAQALGVSESSLKRWCDRGLLKTVRTAGGHRRLELVDVLQFLRDSGREIVRPELLRLPATVGQGPTILARASEQIREALLAGDEEQCRRVVFDLYLGGRSACEIFDQVLAPAFHDIGHGWESGSVAVYRERRACEIALKTLHDLRRALPEPAVDAPMALGGTLERDPYCLPTAMVEVVLREAGWRATSLGTLLPAATFADALRENQPDLLWISVSTISSIPDFIGEYSQLHDLATALGTPIAVGGRALTADVRQQVSYSTYCDTLRHLVTFAGSIDRRSQRRRKSKSQK